MNRKCCCELFFLPHRIFIRIVSKRNDWWLVKVDTMRQLVSTTVLPEVTLSKRFEAVETWRSLLHNRPSELKKISSTQMMAYAFPFWFVFATLLRTCFCSRDIPLTLQVCKPVSVPFRVQYLLRTQLSIMLPFVSMLKTTKMGIVGGFWNFVTLTLKLLWWKESKSAISTKENLNGKRLSG
jgi:hypothetical protein